MRSQGGGAPFDALNQHQTVAPPTAQPVAAAPPAAPHMLILAPAVQTQTLAPAGPSAAPASTTTVDNRVSS